MTDALHDTPQRRITLALVLTAATMVVSIAGGLLSHSLALLSDAGHMLADAGALVLALIAQRVAERPRTEARTYGSRRAETVAAFVNAIFLGVVSMWVIVEAVERWRRPPDVHGGWMLAVAAVGLAMNLLAARVLAAGHTHNDNIRAALAHVLSDVAGSAAAMGAAFFILAFGWRRADPLISLLLAALILWSAWKLVARTADVLMEGTPRGLEHAELERTIRETPGVREFHDLHAWTISSGFDVVTVHVVLDGSRHGTEVAREVSDRIHQRHRIEHVTVQPEAPPAEMVSFQPISTIVRRREG
ncbi:MAG TPA: cation diffusion facilitator family transporter [Vicinamibacteria bacterium]|jgi:cobalt-zinc-cadmium efflux system protein|nr:cation diffusion facilitator family transporter [Vicinamibacteria bacterium]